MSMFADEVKAPRDTWIRQKQPDCCPTDAQAEVLIHRQVPLQDVIGIVVESASQAADTYVILDQLGVATGDFPLFVSPDFYLPRRLAGRLRAGQRPVEKAWHPPANASGEALDG